MPNFVAANILKEENKFEKTIKYNGNRECVVESDSMHLVFRT